MLNTMTYSHIKTDPKRNCPTDILANQVVLTVKFFNFDGIESVGNIEIHKDLKKDIEKIFNLIHKERFPIEKVIPISEYNWEDEKSCNDNNTSGFNYRLISGTNKLSKHATGYSLDINPYQNHYIKYEITKDDNGKIIDIKETQRFPNTEYNLEEKGTIRPNSNIVKLFKSLGWDWGGDWARESGRIDYQHFEKNIKDN